MRDRRARRFFDLSYFLDLPEPSMIERRLERSAGGTDPWDDPDYINGPMVEATRRLVLPQRHKVRSVLLADQPTEALAQSIARDIATFRFAAKFD
jgi:hypothetical protein